uniref:Uncharacterized protein n=1 Tax=Rhizophora mucronata TaxID=61149 RepID=A0A2P2PW64_RHIMU
MLVQIWAAVLENAAQKAQAPKSPILPKRKKFPAFQRLFLNRRKNGP